MEREKSIRKRARQKLGSKQRKNVVSAELPGGCWRETSYLEFVDHADDIAPGSIHEEDIRPRDLPDSNTAEELMTGLKISEQYPVAEEKSLRNRTVDITRDKAAPTTYAMSGQEEEEIRKQKVKQRALLRRLYMDMEREQVKEYKKMKVQLERIAQIKQAKEKERSRQELEAAVACSPDTAPPRTSLDSARRLAAQERSLQKQKETSRYIKALRSMLKEKIDRLCIDVPPLCSCGSSIWDTHPDLCANNCPFYKNPKGYERAVQALLASCDVLG